MGEDAGTGGVVTMSDDEILMDRLGHRIGHEYRQSKADKRFDQILGQLMAQPGADKEALYELESAHSAAVLDAQRSALVYVLSRFKVKPKKGTVIDLVGEEG
jgi:hypothetical protein